MGNDKLIKRDPLWSTTCEETEPNQLFIDINEADSITSRNDRPLHTILAGALDHPYDTMACHADV